MHYLNRQIYNRLSGRVAAGLTGTGKSSWMKYAGTHGDWAPDHGGPRYHLKTKYGEISAFDTHRNHGDLDEAVAWLRKFESEEDARKKSKMSKKSKMFLRSFLGRQFHYL